MTEAMQFERVGFAIYIKQIAYADMMGALQIVYDKNIAYTDTVETLQSEHDGNIAKRI